MVLFHEKVKQDKNNVEEKKKITTNNDNFTILDQNIPDSIWAETLIKTLQQLKSTDNK